MTKQEIFEEMKRLLISKFEIEESKIQLDTTIVDDLDLDSIDIIDLIIELDDNLVVSSDDFIDVRTIGDIADKIVEILNRNK